LSANLTNVKAWSFKAWSN